MQNDEIVGHLTMQIHFLNQRYENDRAQELDNTLSRWLGVEPCIETFPVVAFLYRRKNISLEVILNYLNVHTALYLNMMNAEKIAQSLNAFDIVAHGQRFNTRMANNHLLMNAEFLYRLGRYDKAKGLLKRVTESSKDADMLSKAYMMSGQIAINEYHSFYPEAAMEPLAKSLGEAEKINDESSIINIYGEIGRMLGKEHPALGLSMHWKAQVLAEKLKDDHKIYVSRLYRARSYIEIMMRYNGLNKPEVYRKEAERLISSIDRNKIPSESLKAFYDETFGYLMGDDATADRALDYFIEHHAYDKVYELAENISGRAIFKKDFEKLNRMMDLCMEAAKAMKSPEKIRRVVEGKKMLRQYELEREKKQSDK